jgi:hypothetical protein
MEQELLNNSLTSSTADSGPAGSSTVHLSEEDNAVLVGAMQIAEAMNADLIPYLFRINDGFADVPELGDDEPECYFWPEPPKQADAGNMGEDGEPMDDPALEEDPTKPADMAMLALKQIVQLQRRAKHAHA